MIPNIVIPNSPAHRTGQAYTVIRHITRPIHNPDNAGHIICNTMSLLTTKIIVVMTVIMFCTDDVPSATLRIIASLHLLLCNNGIMRSLLQWRVIFSYSIYLFTLGIACCLGAGYYFIHNPWLYLTHLNPAPCHESVLLDDEGIVWARFQLDQRNNISLTQIPHHVIHAFIATEDRQFYTHSGISWYGIMRSIVFNIMYRRFAQGASTITQQLVRLLLGDTTKTLSRKIKEQLLAIALEQQCSKDYIMEMYLNNLYFGCGIYGVSAAAQRFWNKHPRDLTIDESAVLAGIVKNPNKYCPLINSIYSLQRRNVVLNCMAQAGFIPQEDLHALQQRSLSTIRDDVTTCYAPHARDTIRQQLEKTLGLHRLYRGGLTIKTTLNSTMQQHAQLCFKTSLEQLRARKQKPIDGALVCIHSASGDIKAMVGGYDYSLSQFNRATHARRQLGSIFKPILYTVGLERNMSLATIDYDEPLKIIDHHQVWAPGNVTKRFDGPMTLARALISSNNIIAIKTALTVGTQTIAQKAHECGLPLPHPYASLALGCIDATPVEATGMFNVLVNQGYYVKPHLIQWVKDADGSIIWQEHIKPHAVFSWASCSTIIHVLQQAVGRWVNYLGLTPLPCAATGKTGTTNEARNCWFVGATPHYTTAVYLGADDNTSLGNTYTIRSAFPLWLAFNHAINQAPAEFRYDPLLRPLWINSITGEQVLQPTAYSINLLEVACPKQRTAPHDQPAEPSSISSNHNAPSPDHWIPDGE